MLKELKIGIIVADEDEFKPLVDSIKEKNHKIVTVLNHNGLRFKFSNNKRETTVIAVLCGIGKVNAAAMASALVCYGCNVILNYGLSGGISGVCRGDICIPEKFLEHDFDLTGIGYKPCEKPNQRYVYCSDSRINSILKKIAGSSYGGTAVTGDRFVCSDDERKFLHKNFNASCCDMETAAIAYVCDSSDIPFSALRRISDEAGNDAVDKYREMNTSSETVLVDSIIECIRLLSYSEEF